MKTLWAGALLTLAAAVSLMTGVAAAAPVKTQHVEAELLSQTSGAAPGSTLYVALRQKIVPGWHTYWRNPGDAGQATSLTWTLPAGWTAGDIVWPTPERYIAGPLMNYVFSDEVYLPVPITVPADAQPGQTVTLKAAADWLVCKDVCVPEDATLALDVPVTSAPTTNPLAGKAITDTLAAAPKPAGLKAAFQRRRHGGDALYHRRRGEGPGRGPRLLLSLQRRGAGPDQAAVGAAGSGRADHDPRPRLRLPARQAARDAGRGDLPRSQPRL